MQVYAAETAETVLETVEAGESDVDNVAVEETNVDHLSSEVVDENDSDGLLTEEEVSAEAYA